MFSVSFSQGRLSMGVYKRSQQVISPLSSLGCLPNHYTEILLFPRAFPTLRYVCWVILLSISAQLALLCSRLMSGLLSFSSNSLSSYLTKIHQVLEIQKQSWPLATGGLRTKGSWPALVGTQGVSEALSRRLLGTWVWAGGSYTSGPS